jgi:hypothetical protein
VEGNGIHCFSDATRGVLAVSERAETRKKILAIADRMILLFIHTGLKSASREMVEKWAAEIEAALKEKK